MSDNELGAFLRARRETVTPAQVGLPAGARRRTPGLRRAELATIAGISVDYLTRLEQGRDRHPSPQVFGALADALRLSPDERILLAILAKAANGYVCTGAVPPANDVRTTVRALLEALEPAPALVLNRRTDVVAHTNGYARLAAPLGLLDTRPPNLARFVFTDARARATYPDWDRVADQQVAHLKLDAFGTNPHIAELAAELTILAGAPFTTRWQSPPALPARTGIDRLTHPDAGELLLAYETLDLADADGARLLVYLPADEPTAGALDQLTQPRSSTLRAVTG